MPIQIGGIVSGIDTEEIVGKLLEFDARGKKNLETKKTKTTELKDLFGEFNTKLVAFKSEADKLQLSSTFQKRSVATTDSDIISATVTDSAAIGVYTIAINNKATQSTRQSSAVISLSESVRSTSPVTAGTSPIDLSKTFATAGFDSSLDLASRITIDTSGGGTYTSAAVSTYASVQAFMDEINADADLDARMWYDATNDRFNLEMKNDTARTIDNLANTAGNFFTEINIAVGNPGAVNEVGLNVNATLVNLNTDTAITAGTGSFAINGTTINYDTSADTFQNLLNRINSAQASTGVTAFYDQTLDRMVLTRQTEGPQQIDVDVTNDTRGVMTGGGLKISTAATTAGLQAEFFINEPDGSTSMITSDSNTYTFNGITINIKGDGNDDTDKDPAATDQAATITITQDTASVATAIKSFVTAYNDIAKFRQDNATYNADSETAGKLFGDSLVNSVDSRLKGALFQAQPSLIDTHELLAQIGIRLGDFASAEANNLVVDDAKLTNAIAANPAAVEQLFGRSTSASLVKNTGIAFDISTYITELTKFQGLVDIKDEFFDNQIEDIDERIAREDDRLERIEANLRRQFNTMETLLARINAEGASISQQLSRL